MFLGDEGELLLAEFPKELPDDLDTNLLKLIS